MEENKKYVMAADSTKKLYYLNKDRIISLEKEVDNLERKVNNRTHVIYGLLIVFSIWLISITVDLYLISTIVNFKVS